MLLHDLLESPQSDRSIRNLALKVLRQASAAEDTAHGWVTQKASNGNSYKLPLIYTPSSFPDLVIGMMAVPIGLDAGAFMFKIKNETNLPESIKYVIAYPYSTRRPWELEPDNLPFNINTFLYALKRDKSTFLHEFVHYWDHTHTKVELNRKIDITHGTKYYNDVLERNAYYNEALYALDKKRKEFFQQPFKIFLKQALKYFDKTFLSSLEESNKKRLMSRLYAVWQDKNKA